MKTFRQLMESNSKKLFTPRWIKDGVKSLDHPSQPLDAFRHMHHLVHRWGEDNKKHKDTNGIVKRYKKLIQDKSRKYYGSGFHTELEDK